ncbi:MAG: VIT and VWA domain-containing protein [Blastocatellia bacterium]|nr:VIT and VWA domain-containing protein [Blastocatellia bacterium]
MNRRNTSFLFWYAAIGLLIASGLCFPALRTRAQTGALIPTTNRNAADASILSLQTMKVEIRIDNQNAWVRVLQIFDNHTPQVLEGKYLFALPPQAVMADFAVWDGELRLPGVMLEKRRANQIYSEIKAQAVDPGLLQQDDEHGGTSAFSAKVFPIPAHGAKRVELEYTEMLAVEDLTSRFSFPLKPSHGSPQTVGELLIDVRVISDSPISPLRFRSGAYPMQAVAGGPNEQGYRFQGRNVALSEDLSFEYGIEIPASGISFIAHRAPERVSAYDLRDPASAATSADGYFEARAIFKGEAAKEGQAAARNVLLLLDTSLSMNGAKLARAIEGLDFVLHNLGPQDRFNLALFNDEVAVFSPTAQPATPENVARALAFVRGSMLGGGTDLRGALLRAVQLSEGFPAGERSIVLISDANSTMKTSSAKRIAREFNEANGSDRAQKTRLFALALGSDADRRLLEELTRQCRGYVVVARETEEIAAQLKILFSHLGRPSIDGLRFAGGPGFTQVYSVDRGAGQSLHSFDGAGFAFVGRYGKPARGVEIAIEGRAADRPVRLARKIDLPELEAAHAHLPRLWARARVDALLYEMNLNGEREDYIAEIIRLSQKYKFVTPYTAFLAAPRSLLRPRVIQPGDPVIRVRTDPSIREVFAVLPFGETLPLRYLQREGVWEARFLAPAWMADGTYRCRLLLTDRQGNGYQEEKSFVVDSHAPRVTIDLPSRTVRAGEELLVRVRADRDAMRLVAKLYGAAPIPLAWSDKEKANIGRLRIPHGLAPGQYALTVSAEDFAHNQTTAEIRVSIL